jgi:undecaprenyl-diphosphatase
MGPHRSQGQERRRAFHQWRQLAQFELVQVLLVALVIVAGTWGFAKLAGEVVEGDTRAFDYWLLHALRSPEDPAWPRGPRWLVEAGRDITAFGSSVVVALLTAAVVGYLLLRRTYGAMWFVVSATAGGGLLSHLLKAFFARERPPPVPCLWVSSPSFPSGHAVLAMVVYLTLGILLARLEPKPLLKAYFLGGMLALALMVGVSRVYLGIHYPTDVLAGWTVGLIWGLLCWSAAWYLQRRGAVEQEYPEQT